MNTPLLDVSDLTVSYGRVQAVQGVSFRVEQGAVVAIVGANGAGKTTTLAALTGLLPIQRGQVLLRGEDITRKRPHEVVARGVAHVPEGRQMLARLSVGDNLRMGAYQRRDRNIDADLRAMFERFPVLAERRTLSAGSLSGGEQQMLAIARGLMARPTLLLLDEPSMGLAPLLVDEVFRILRGIRDEGMTIVVVEQNARKALAFASYAYVMETGRIALEGPSSELMQNEQVTAVYLGSAGLAAE